MSAAASPPRSPDSLIDVVVVGEGVMGAASAWQLARRGRRVLLFDQFAAGHTRGLRTARPDLPPGPRLGPPSPSRRRGPAAVAGTQGRDRRAGADDHRRASATETLPERPGSRRFWPLTTRATSGWILSGRHGFGRECASRGRCCTSPTGRGGSTPTMQWPPSPPRPAVPSAQSAANSAPSTDTSRSTGMSTTGPRSGRRPGNQRNGLRAMQHEGAGRDHPRIAEAGDRAERSGRTRSASLEQP
jgi:hypothetical protein